MRFCIQRIPLPASGRALMLQRHRVCVTTHAQQHGGKTTAVFRAEQREVTQSYPHVSTSSRVPMHIGRAAHESTLPASSFPATSSPLESFNDGTLGFGFSAGGLLFPYYVGIIMALRDELGILTPETMVAGASAGSLIAATSKSGISENDLVEATLRLAHDCRKNGTRFRLRKVLQRTLEDVLPDDIHERCNGTVHVAVTHVWPKFQSQLVSQFRSRQELISTLLVSCHIPWYFDGSLVTGFRAGLAFDGGLTNLIPVPPNCPGAVRVACFPAENLRIYRNIGISPSTFEEWPHDMPQMIKWALEPASEEMLLSLHEKGKRDARSWAKLHGFSAAAQPLVQAAIQLPGRL